MFRVLRKEEGLSFLCDEKRLQKNHHHRLYVFKQTTTTTLIETEAREDGNRARQEARDGDHIHPAVL